jgi:phosphoglycerate dehydrogenase-like enzyme
MSRPRVHLYPSRYRNFFQPVVDRLTEHETVFLDDIAHLEAELPEIEVLVVLGPVEIDWAPAERLRLIQVGGAGVDRLLPATGLPDRVVVTNASGSHEPEMPEFVIALLFALAYRIPDYVDQQRRHEWRNRMPRALAGSTLCVVGLGTIGQSVASRAAALGMRVTGVRRSGAPVDGVDRVVTMDRRLDALAGADALVVVAPMTDETRGLIGPAELAVLAPGSIMVDVSRGGVSDIDAVVASLGSGHLAAAAIDVFEPEPLPESSPLWDVPNLLVTPHTAGNSPGYVARWAAVLADNLDALDSGAPLTNVVDRRRGY